MNKDEYLALKLVKPKLITAEDLTDRTPRKLMDGYTVDRADFVVLLTDHEIVVLIDGMKVKPTTNEGYAPNKRAYPTLCDAEFVRLLLAAEVPISFTNTPDDWFSWEQDMIVAGSDKRRHKVLWASKDGKRAILSMPNDFDKPPQQDPIITTDTTGYKRVWE